MKGFKDFLIEMAVPEQEAMDLFVLDPGFTLKELKQSFRRLSMKFHPDVGGDVEKMKLVNVYFDYLKKQVSQKDKNEKEAADHEDFNTKWNETAINIRGDLIRNVDVPAYTKYFTDTFNEPFTAEITKISPDDKEIERVRKSNHRHSIYNVFHETTFSNKDKTKVFNLHISVYVASLIRTSKGLGTSDTTYPMSVSTFAYIDSRRIKITGRDYTQTNKKNVFNKPATVFPKSKITSKKKTAFKKSHMLAALKAELNAYNSGDFYYVKTGDEQYFAIYRSTFMRQAMWNIQGVYEKNDRGRYINKKMKFTHMSFTETEDFLNTLRKIQTLSVKDSLKLLTLEYNKLIGK